LPLFQPFDCCHGFCARYSPLYARQIAVPFNSKSSLPTVAFNKDAFPNRQHIADWTKSFSLPKQAQVSRVSF
jgi:hypothetical protein